MIAEQGRLAWQVATGYGQRSLVETTMGQLQSADRTASARPRFCGSADRGGHRRGGAEPDVGSRTPRFRPSPAGHRIAEWGLGPSRRPSGSAPTPSATLFSLRDASANRLHSRLTVSDMEPVWPAWNR